MRSWVVEVAVALIYVCSLHRFEKRCDALPDPDAHRREAVPAAAAPQFVQQRGCDPRAACAKRMAERNRAAVDVRLRERKFQVAQTCDRLRGEGLVDLDEIEIAARNVRDAQRLACRWDRPEAHHVGTNAG